MPRAASFAFLFVFLLGWIGFSQGAEPGEDQAEARRLAKAHLQAAKKGLETELKVFRVQQLYIWSRRILFAELELYEKAEERITAFENHLSRVKEFELKIIDLNRSGAVAIQDLVEARFQRARAEAWLAEAKVKKGKSPDKKRDADFPESSPPVVPPKEKNK